MPAYRVTYGDVSDWALAPKQNGNYEKVIDESGNVKEYHYLNADAGLFGIFVKTNGVSVEKNYILTDHLGSLTKVLDANGNLEQSYSYDAWGTVRDANDWSQSLSGVEVLADRGFTGHEHLPSVFGLIDMNGRMYDPVLGRLLSPDPYVQSPDYAQNFNRYAYCLNNPLCYTDPSGEYAFVDDLGVFLVGGLVNVAFNINNIDNLAEVGGYFLVGGTSSVVSYYCPPVGGAIAMAGNELLSTNFLTEEKGYSFSSIKEDEWGRIGKSAVIGFVTGYIGGKVNNFSSNKISNNISNPFWQESVDNMVVGAVTDGLASYSSAVWIDKEQWNSKEAFVEFGEGAGTGAIMGFSFSVVEHKVVDPAMSKMKEFNLSLKIKNNEYNLNIKVDSYWHNQPYPSKPNHIILPDPYWNNQPFIRNNNN